MQEASAGAVLQTLRRAQPHHQHVHANPDVVRQERRSVGQEPKAAVRGTLSNGPAVAGDRAVRGAGSAGERAEGGALRVVGGGAMVGVLADPELPGLAGKLGEEVAVLLPRHPLDVLPAPCDRLRDGHDGG